MDVRTFLHQTYPNCFAGKGESKPPLKVGIYHDIRASYGLAAKDLSAALHDYTSGPTYLRNLKAGADRLDLSGNPAGAVSEGEAKVAAARMGRIRKWQRAGKLAAALKDAREFVAQNLAELLESCCVIGADGKPDRSTLDHLDAPEIERVEAVLARIDEALGATHPTTEVGEGTV